jgi:hypothetical protein
MASSIEPPIDGGGAPIDGGELIDAGIAAGRTRSSIHAVTAPLYRPSVSLEAKRSRARRSAVAAPIVRTRVRRESSASAPWNCASAMEPRD